VARFRTIPDGPALPYVLAHIAPLSARRAADGWTWKFDPKVFERKPLSPDDVAVVDCRAALLRAETGLLSAAMSDDVYDRMGRRAPVVTILGAGHHIMLDQPLALITALRTIIAAWEHSMPVSDGTEELNRQRPADEAAQ
jgi:pimeloyl-ACP methyl ester carboxylesterase